MPGPELGVKLYADTAELRDDLGKAAHVSEKEMAAIARSATIAGAAIGTMAVAAAVAMGHLVKKTIDGAEQINKLSQRTGIAAEHLSEMKFAAELSDVSMGQLSTAVSLFNQRLVEAQDQSSKSGMLFKALGVDIKAGPHAALMQFAEAVRGLSTTEAQVAVLRQAFGRAGDGMLPFILNLRDSTAEARRLGLTVSTEMARDAEKFNDNVKKLESGATTVGIALANKLLPPLVAISEKLVEARKNGQLFETWLRDMGKLAVSPAWFAYSAMNPPPTDAPRAFQADVRRTEPPEPRANQDEVVCIASGGRWENGRCVRQSDRGTDRLGSRSDAEDLLAQQEMIEFNDTLIRQGVERNRQERERLALLQQRSETEDLLAQHARLEERDDITRAAALRERKQETKELNDAARQLGFTFASAFEDAVLEGKKLREVLNAIARDIARIILRQTVTTPIANAVAGYFSGSTPVARAEGGHVMPNNWALVGERGPELAYFGPGGGNVIPSGETHGGRAMQSRTVVHRNVANVQLSVGSLDPRHAAQVILQNGAAIRSVIRSAFNHQGKPSPI